MDRLLFPAMWSRSVWAILRPKTGPGWSMRFAKSQTLCLSWWRISSRITSCKRCLMWLNPHRRKLVRLLCLVFLSIGRFLSTKYIIYCWFLCLLLKLCPLNNDRSLPLQNACEERVFEQPFAMLAYFRLVVDVGSHATSGVSSFLLWTCTGCIFAMLLINKKEKPIVGTLLHPVVRTKLFWVKISVIKICPKQLIR